MGTQPAIHGGAAQYYQAQLDGKVVALKGYVETLDGCRLHSHFSRNIALETIAPSKYSWESTSIACRVNYVWCPWMKLGNIAQFMKDPEVLEAHTDRCVRMDN